MLTIINTATPYQQEQARESLDAIMMAVSMDLPVQVIFMHDGVWQLIPRQTSALNQKNHLAKYQLLADLFEHDDLYVHQGCLDERALTADSLQIKAAPLSAEQLSMKLANATKILRF